jgi:cytochrome c oxidase cbb3-type subunit 3
MKQNIKRSMSKRLLVLLSIMFIPFISFAETKAGDFPFSSEELLLILVLSVLVFVLLVLGYAVYMFNVFLTYTKPEIKQRPGILSDVAKFLSDAVPVEEENTILTDHDYDGIRELDNNLPLWWKYMFYLTIIFSVAYIYYYHYSGSGMLQEQEYTAQMDQAEKDKEAYAKANPNSINENTVKILSTPKVIEQGKKIFIDNCAVCHSADGGGKVGPNLTDTYWIHGKEIKNVFLTITNGVPGKMQAWKNQLSSSDVQNVANYVLSLQGTTPASPKAPEGTEVK